MPPGSVTSTRERIAAFIDGSENDRVYQGVRGVCSKLGWTEGPWSPPSSRRQPGQPQTPPAALEIQLGLMLGVRA
jgi:hypothetical protein